MKSTRTLYQHPDGARVEFDPVGRELAAIDADGTLVFVGIGPLGLVDLAAAMHRAGIEWGDALRKQDLMG